MKGKSRKLFNYLELKVVHLSNKSRSGIVLLILFITIWEYTSGIRTMIKTTGEPISPYFFPIFMSDYIVATGVLKVLILLAFIVIDDNTSKMGSEKYFYIVRAGRNVCAWGDILFTFVIALVYSVFLFIFSLLCFVPGIKFQNGWGKIIGTLAYTDAASQYGSMFIIPDRMVELNTPVYSVLMSMLLLVLCCFFIGLLLYAANAVTRSNVIGPIIACGLILSSPIAAYFRQPLLIWFSPISWASLNSLQPVNRRGYPPVLYAVLMFLLFISILTIIIIRNAKKADIRGAESE